MCVHPVTDIVWSCFSFLSLWEIVDKKEKKKKAQEAWTTLWGMPLSVALDFSFCQILGIKVLESGTQ